MNRRHLLLASIITPVAFGCTAYGGDDHEATSTATQASADPGLRAFYVNQHTIRYKRPDASGAMALQKDPWSGGWVGDFTQADEPERNFCGPTAAKNLLVWYGYDVPYARAAHNLKASNFLYNMGTKPYDMYDFLKSRAPAGMQPAWYRLRSDPQVIIDSIRNGHPVMVLISMGATNLHWAVATGIYVDSYGAMGFRMANAPDMSLRDFVRNWSLSRFEGVSAYILQSSYNIRPYTAMAYVPDAGYQAIQNKYEELYASGLELGYPDTAIAPTPDGQGRYVHFDGWASIYWHPSLGAYSVIGDIRNLWAQQGWERGALGFPISDEITTPDGIGRYSLFQGGWISWRPELGASITLR